MTTRDQIIKAVKKAAGEKDIHLEFSEHMEHGDYATNVALILGKKQKANPRELANTLVSKLKKDNSLKNIVSKIEVAGPGFINFHLSEKVLFDTLVSVKEQKDAFGTTSLLKNKRIIFEYGQPNTHKLPHIGHLFSYVYGESMARLLSATGHEIRKVNYQGDVGPHVAKCLWAFILKNPKIPKGLDKKIELLQKMYQKGATAYIEDENAKKEIDQLNKKIYEKDSKIYDLWKETRSWSLEYYKGFENRIGVDDDRYYFESEVFQKGIDIVKEHLGGIFKKSQGAIIFEGSKYGLHDRVFVTGKGTAPYEAKDLALQMLKMEEWPADLLVITTASEQNEYFKVVFKALEILDSSFKGKLKHVGFGMVQLKSGKISSREGNIIGGIELVNVTVDKI